MSPPRKTRKISKKKAEVKAKPTNKEVKAKPVKQPDGFIRFEVDNVSTLTFVGRSSPVIEYGGVQWNAQVGKSSGFVFGYLKCLYKHPKAWRINAEAEFTVVNEDNTKSVTKERESFYEKYRDSIGAELGKCVDLKKEDVDLVDEKKGFVKDDKITLEIRFRITKMVGPDPKGGLRTAEKDEEERKELDEKRHASWGQVRDNFYPWMSEVKRRRFPYVAQLGDQVVYFRQGHEDYLNAVVKDGSLFPIDARVLGRLQNLKLEEFAEVTEVKYILAPWRLTRLTLASTDAKGRRTGRQWIVEHFDMDDISDFMILREFYDEGLAMGLKVGDEVAAPMDGLWWTGEVKSIKFNESYAKALWQSIGVRWGKEAATESIAMWDLTKNTTGRATGDPVTEEEVISRGTVPYGEGDWPEGDENGEETRERIMKALRAIVKCDEAKEFRKPVDLKERPDYASKVPYPMDISTIYQRIDNQYYRRLRSLLQDVRQVAVAAANYYGEGAEIVSRARVLVEAVIRMAKDPSIEDGAVFFNYCFHLRDDEVVEWKGETKPEVKSDKQPPIGEPAMAEPVQVNGRQARSGLLQPEWITETNEILEDLMQQPFARHFVIKDMTNLEMAPVWNPPCYNLLALSDKVRGFKMNTPKEIEDNVNLLVARVQHVIQNKKSEILTDLEKLQSQFNARFKKVYTTFDKGSSMAIL